MFFLLVLSFIPHFVLCWFRVPCTTPLVSERIDPINSYGLIPSNHVHTVHGAQNFAANATYQSIMESNCTSCQVAEDKSNYWFPTLYYHDKRNGTFAKVPNGRLLLYYQNRGELAAINGGPGLKPFPPGFRMVTGSPISRSRKYPVGTANQDELRQKAIEWVCLGNPLGEYRNSATGEGFPHSNCPGGFNARLHFPNCWDGIDIDSPDHRSHVAFLDRLDNGICPEEYPVGLVTLFYEVTWDVDHFVQAGLWNPETERWPFVYSTGDPTGHSWHGDFLNGWPEDVLANAISNCDSPSNAGQSAGITESCPYLTVVSGDVGESCKLKPVVDEPIIGPLSRLPGCNPLQLGPEDAVLYSDLDCPKLEYSHALPRSSQFSHTNY